MPIDVTTSRTWTDGERKLIRKYYMAGVPATVVLAPDRSPLLLTYQRITGPALETVLEDATR